MNVKRQIRTLIILTAVAHGAHVAQASAGDISTTSWGVMWERPPTLPSAVSETNTPGSVSFSGRRFIEPAYYAFLDGFDTRKYKHECTNTADRSSGIVIIPSEAGKVTNTTHRLGFYESFKRRKDTLRLLSVYDDAAYDYTLRHENGYWGSTFMDGLQELQPKKHNFDWTTDVIAEICPTNGTGWFPVFYGLRHSNTYKPQRTDRYRSTFSGLALDVINKITFGDPSTVAALSAAGDATPFTFEHVLSNAYPNAVATNLLADTRRTIEEPLAAANQTLALMDKTTKIMSEVYIISNETDTSYEASITAAGQYSSPITLARTPDGVWSASPLDGHFEAEMPESKSKTTVTNHAVYSDLYSPSMRVSAPGYGCACSVEITNVTILARDGDTDAFSINFRETVFNLFPELNDGATVTARLAGEYSDDRNAGGIRVDIYKGGYYGWYVYGDTGDGGTISVARGRAIMSAHYTAHVRDQFDSGASRLYYEPWPADTEYLRGGEISCTYMSSYAATRDSRNIDFDLNEIWDKRIGYGYRAYSYDIPPNGYRAFLVIEAGMISAKMHDMAGNYTNPFSYTGLDNSAYFGTLANSTNWRLNMRDQWFPDVRGKPRTVTVEIRKGGWNMLMFRLADRLDGSTDFKYELRIFSRDFTLELDSMVTPSAYELKRDPFTFQSKIGAVGEAKWDWPQVKRSN